MTLQFAPDPTDFPYIEETFLFFLYECTLWFQKQQWPSLSSLSASTPYCTQLDPPQFLCDSGCFSLRLYLRTVPSVLYAPPTLPSSVQLF